MLQRAATQPVLVHFRGVGGAGMRALASVMDGTDVSISGSDGSRAMCEELAGHGWSISPTSQPVDLSEVDLVVCSDAIPADDPVRRAAARQGLAVQSYAAAVGRQLTGQTRVAIAGTHGKSTTTAMAAEILTNARLDPTIICGAVPRGGWSSTGGRRGRNDLVVVEACEYRDNFLKLPANVAAITNIEPDHFDFFETSSQLAESFRRFAERIDRTGVLVAGHECSATMDAARTARCRIETFGLRAKSDWSADVRQWRDGYAELQLRFRRRNLAKVKLQVPGRHNAMNAVAAAAIAMHCGARPSDVTAGLAGFVGLRRRLQRLGEFLGLHIWDDYAHHPTEIRSTLDTLRKIHSTSRIICIFQPHQVSRTTALFADFVESLQLADLVLIAPIFRARERHSQAGEITARDLASCVSRCGTPSFACRDFHSIRSVLKLVCCTGDVLATLGAGDIWKISHAFAD
ncbi:MAG: UDP-N-acetylmuramate--L-alanine ligase [Pirellulales bacterium]